MDFSKKFLRIKTWIVVKMQLPYEKSKVIETEAMIQGLNLVA